MKRNESDKRYNRKFFENVKPIKLTECRILKLQMESWGLLSDYALESVKINRYKPNVVSTTAVLRVADISGKVTCILRGNLVGLLFGLTCEEWTDIEDMCACGQQLFYRYFKDGLSKNFSCEQKLFYNFCHSNQKEDVLVAVFKRINNTRNKDRSDPLIDIVHLTKQNGVMDLYINHLKLVK